jgi:aspartyl-tRNA(Asn)/glutamyl-tRNA(Gln) amidotransferase subunit C
MKQAVNKQLVKHIAQLANIPISAKEEEELAKDFSETLEVVDKLQKIDTQGVEMTHQVTGLVNITREDKTNEKNMFTQKEALANASRTHDGFFVVERLIDVE